ncbi:hypothetical protein ACFOQM_07085 [Paenibacillus sp. GCM10012307]
MFHLMIYTGGRKWEILALRWSDVDLKNKTISFNKTLFHEDGESVALTSKTVSSWRSISLDETNGHPAQETPQRGSQRAASEL